LLVATTSRHKLEEYRALLAGLPFELRSLSETAINADVEETGESFEANARLKAEHYAQLSGMLTLADDSGLCVDALGGRPGVHSARYAENPPARIRKILEEMTSVPEGRRNAAFYCALALARAGRTIWTVQGDVAGVIAHAPSGSSGFGYDPVFALPELNRTMADLSTDDKNRLSARGKALAELRKFLLSH